MRVKEFYEGYWQQDYAPPQSDPTSAQRMVRLEAVLGPLMAASRGTTRHVLDAGCGDGAFLVFLRRLGLRVSGLELAEAAAARARRRCPDADVQVGSLEEPPVRFDDQTFDAVWCSEVLEQLFGVHNALAELNRLLKPGGLLMLTTPYHGFAKNLLIAAVAFDGHYNPDLSHIRFFTRRTLARSLRRAGFEPVRWEGLGRVWPLWKSVFVVARKAGPPGPPPQVVG
ncbi:MAG TPA: class I SAM-dependent methyltransferase [Verrucomicrobiae bacterium]|jgi:SAM-dependent methyltransferase|nr:class I SAM-dependent methyltransferase [Verrucomicrobiae bacterium]